MEASRPDPVRLDKFVVGEARFDVLAQLGAPIVAREKKGDQTCDIYKLYTHGPGAVGKGVIVAGEAVADVFTAGLFEVVATPGEAATKNKLHAVVFCYSADDKLVSYSESPS
jgi:hypothetical protein